MRTDTPQTIYLKDYRPSPYQVNHVDLIFDLHEGESFVTSELQMEMVDGCAEDLFLHGEDLELIELELNGSVVNNYTQNDKGLVIPNPGVRAFTLKVKTRIKPEENTRLEGLYKSGGNFCTQCEAEGFRRITFYLDRPDIMATYTTRIEADREKYPVLLGNGNKTEDGDLGHGRHYAVWHDPYVKPCYLFALVAGKLNHIHDTYTTGNGRKVDLYIYVRPGDEGQCAHAMESLKKSMKWDEEVYGLEYDLNVFNIVAVSDFNMGAMENKGLNIFNTALVLAAQETATDTDFSRVESVIAHEYFHNWSGNRVTCRDWFQLSLKEGLTVFRDQAFSADLNSRDVQRIDDVTHLRRFQFAEDASPLSHPIRPDNYIEINNFYTMTVYEKGAEVIRMLRTILGAETYRKATDLYFERHDGQAVTCDDWLTCMEDASGLDLSQFKLWYSQAGTPAVTFKGQYDAATKTYTAALSQAIPDTTAQSCKKPMHIPVAFGLLGPDGADLIGTEILHLKGTEQSFVFEGINSKPVPSVLRGFSAPVKLQIDYSDNNLRYLMAHDSDGFNRWEAAQRYYLRVLESVVKQADVPEAFLDTYGELLGDALQGDCDKALMARTLSLPDVTTIGQQQDSNIDPEAIYKARQKVLASIKRTHKNSLEKVYETCSDDGAFSIAPEAMGQRSLRNLALALLTATHGTGCAKRAKEHYFTANNMTDRMAALVALAPNENPEREEVFAEFYNRYKDYQLVIDKWFAVQSGNMRKDLINHLIHLRQHPDFNIKNPNRTRALFAAFAMNNPAGFHGADGSGYKFLTDGIIELNGINPQIAARLLTPMREWRRYTPERQDKMKEALERILAISDLSPDVFEIACKSLKG